MKTHPIIMGLLGCASFCLCALGSIQEGMTRDQVLELRGRPRAGIAQDNREYMEFEDGVTVELTDGRVTDVTAPVAGETRVSELAQSLPAWTDAEVDMIRAAAADFAELSFTGSLVTEAPMVLKVILIGMIALWLITFVAMWKFFVKAGEPGWAILVPVYNMIVMIRIAGKPLWWILLFFIPLVQIIVAIDVDICTARRFGKGVLFGLGLLFFPMLCYPILAFGSATFDPNA